MTIKPIGQNIVVEKDDAKPVEYGGILIPESATRTPRFSPTVRATVLGVGGKVKHLRVGMRIAIQDHAGDDWFYDGKKLTTCREKDIVGMLA